MNLARGRYGTAATSGGDHSKLRNLRRKPIIRGMRISVELILSLLAQGETEEEVLADYPDLERDDIRACLAYARAAIANDTLQAVRVSGQ